MNGKRTGDGGAPCVRCGELTEERLGATPICRACYDIRSSCCQEFGSDDLTTPREEDKPGPAPSDQNG